MIEAERTYSDRTVSFVKTPTSFDMPEEAQAASSKLTTCKGHGLFRHSDIIISVFSVKKPL